MSDIADAKWEPVALNHGNWIPGAIVMYGLRWNQDPWMFNHRALVFYTGEEWRMHAWSVRPGNRFRNNSADQWIDCGVYPSKLSAMRAARPMARLFHGMAPRPGDHTDYEEEA